MKGKDIYISLHAYHMSNKEIFFSSIHMYVCINIYMRNKSRGGG